MILNKIAITLIKTYKLTISPLLGPRCRFYPSCSEYGLEVYKNFSILKASKLLVIRIFKCQPFHPGGHDPIPPMENK